MAGASSIRQLGLYLVPRPRYGIFAGTNTEETRRILREALAEGDYRDPKVIGEYEQAFAERVGAAGAASFGAGRMALFAILQTLDLKPGDEVLLPAYTCVVVPNAIRYFGAVPIFVDIEPVTFNIDAGKARQAITPRTRVICMQHTFGVLCDYRALRALAREHGLVLIEDAAHSLGAGSEGERSGALGDVAYFSTDHSKIINTHLGGMATAREARLAARLRTVQEGTPFLDDSLVRRILQSAHREDELLAASHASWGMLAHRILGRFGRLFYFRDELKTEKPTDYPYPCRLSAPQARLGLSQLRTLDANLAHRRRIAGWLESRMGWYRGTGAESIERHAWLRYSFLVRDRAEFVRRFSGSFDLAIWFTSVVHGRFHNLEAVGYRPGSCPVAERVARHIVNLPTHPEIPPLLVERIWMRNESWVRENLIRA